MKKIILFFTIIIIAQTGFAATIHVPGDSATIQAGIDSALEGDTVLVADGTYTGDGNRDISYNGKNIVVMSENGPEVTIIDVQGSENDRHRGFIFNNGELPASKLSGFTIKNGYKLGTNLEDYGAGIICYESAPTISDCYFINNQCDRKGPALYCVYTDNQTISNCKFLDNFSSGSGGIALDASTVTVENCVFSTTPGNNYFGSYIGGESQIEFYFCTFKHNHYGINIHLSDVLFNNCSFINNDEYHVATSSGSSIELANCLFAFGDNTKSIRVNGGEVSLTCCNIYGNGDGAWVGTIADQIGVNGNISKNPFLCNLSDETNANISYASSCNAYFNECGQIGAKGSGCISEQLPVPGNINFGSDIQNFETFSATPNFIWSNFDTASSIQLAYEIEVGTDDDWSTAEIWSTGGVNSLDSIVQYNGATLSDRTWYFLRIRVKNSNGWGSWIESKFYTHYDLVHKVPKEFPTISAAIEHSISKDTVLVLDGIYTGNGNRDIYITGKSIVVKSENGPEFTIIDCQGDSINNHYAIDFSGIETIGTVFEGFTIQGGYNKSYVYGTIKFGDVHATVKNCIFKNNVSKYGGALYCGIYATLSLENCIFRENYAKIGAGIYSDRSYQIELTNCDFSQNHAELIVSCIYTDNSPINISKCTFIDNSTIQGLTLQLNNQSPAVISNSLFAGNQTTNGPAVIYSQSDLDIDNCTFYGNICGNSEDAIINVTKPPFDESFASLNNCIIAGNPTGIPIKSIFSEVPFELNCCDIFGNPDGDYVGYIEDFYGINGNISEDPLFCDPLSNYLSILPQSPCAPLNNDCGVLIGSEDVKDCVSHAVISIDRSGSMFYTTPLGQSRLDRAKALAHEEVDRLLAVDDVTYYSVYQVAVQYFNATGIILQQDFTDDPTLLHAAIDAIPGPKHDTPLAAAMCQAHCMLDQEAAASRLVFTYTDGLENESQNFDMCSVCDPCNNLIATGWNFDCNPSNPSSCTGWQMCLADQFALTGVNIVHYFGEPINPFDKSNDGLEDMYFLKSTAEESSGGFFYHSDQEANGFICGDANRDFEVNISDAIYIINYVFIGGNPPEPPEAGDVNCDNACNVSDAVWVINYVFIDGSMPCDTDNDNIPDC